MYCLIGGVGSDLVLRCRGLGVVSVAPAESRDVVIRERVGFLSVGNRCFLCGCGNQGGFRENDGSRPILTGS